MEEETDLLEPIAGPSADIPYFDLLTSPTNQINAESVHASLVSLGDLEALEICIHAVTTRPIEDSSAIRAIVSAGKGRGENAVRKVYDDVSRTIAGEKKWQSYTKEEFEQVMADTLGSDEATTNILRRYSHLDQLGQRLETYQSFGHPAEAGPSKPRPVVSKTAEKDNMDVDDPWAEMDDTSAEVEDPWESGSTRSSRSVKSTATAEGVDDSLSNDVKEPPIPISAFLSTPLADSAVIIASSSALGILKKVYANHERELWDYRYSILEAVPPWIPPTEIKEVGLLPQIGEEAREPDGSRRDDITFSDLLHSYLPLPESSLPTVSPRSADEARDWYVSRVDALDSVGLLDLQIAWVQQAVAGGVTGLDALGEELSLLSRLVYDAHLSPSQQSEWSLASWRHATPEAIIKAYLSNASTGTIVSDIRQQILPYLYVLESKAERAGEAHAELVDRHLHDILLSLPLHLALPIFEASKATLPQPERIIKNDVIVARLALACLYGSNTRNDWSIMSSIFECLPVWDVSGGDLESDKEATATTLDSIATFVRPTRAGAHPPTAKDLFVFFTPLPFASLSRALDILDVHLESGEILARWDTPVQLRFLLQSARDKAEQMELAEKMVRRQAGGPHTDARWAALWGDMKKLSGGDDALLRGAFGVLTVEEMMKIYLGGVLASGKFDIARRVIKRLDAEEGVPSSMLETTVLQASREFYENAESGNIHTGDMKLAYDCLLVAPSTDVIDREREFIEATSRIATFSLRSPSGRGTLSPLEIRHSKNRLELVKQILQTSDDAYRHPELMLDLTDKLGYKGDISAKICILAAISGSAIRGADYEVAWTHSQEMFTISSRRRTETDVTWRALVELGSQSDFADIPKKMAVLGQALELCPAENAPEILVIWRKVEEGQMKLSEAAKRRRIAGIKQKTSKMSLSPISPTSGKAQEERVLGSRTAAKAARMAMGFAGERLNFRGSPILPSSLGASGTATPISASGAGVSPKIAFAQEEGRKSGESDRPSFGSMFEGAGVKAGTAEAERVRQQARKALVRGVGWLLGADEREVSGEER